MVDIDQVPSINPIETYYHKGHPIVDLMVEDEHGDYLGFLTIYYNNNAITCAIDGEEYDESPCFDDEILED